MRPSSDGYGANVSDVQRGELGDHRHPRATHHLELGAGRYLVPLGEHRTTASRSPRAGHRPPRVVLLGDVADCGRAPRAGRQRRHRRDRRAAQRSEPGPLVAIRRREVVGAGHRAPSALRFASFVASGER